MTPLSVNDCHPEMDTSPLLDLKDHRIFQILLGMLQWDFSIECIELGPAVSSLNRFGTCPQEGHLLLIQHVFSYLKYSKSKPHNIAIDSNPMEYERTNPCFESLIPDFLQDFPDATEEIDPGFPAP